MSKYIIDLPDNCSWVQWVMTSDKDGHAYFDFKSPEDLTTLDKELSEAYQRGLEEGKKQAKVQAHLDVCHDIDKVAHGNYQKGLDDAWECAKKISLMSPDEIEKVFPGAAKYNRYNLGYSGVEAIERLKAYEQQKADEINVGDEVTAAWGNAVVVRKYTDKDGVERCEYWYYENARISCDVTSNLRKTGRHFPQMAELIKAMKCEQKSCSTCKYSDESDVSKCRGCFSSKGHNMWEPKEGAE